MNHSHYHSIIMAHPTTSFDQKPFSGCGYKIPSSRLGIQPPNSTALLSQPINLEFLPITNGVGRPWLPKVSGLANDSQWGIKEDEHAEGPSTYNTVPSYSTTNTVALPLNLRWCYWHGFTGSPLLGVVRKHTKPVQYGSLRVGVE